ncbi:MAG TPA: class I SAM-dependent methyltransferase [Solirubrobacteraceae bacterium]|nr:class I SAM-dependent methyltransferase [Solirubrobacteraceae bacterium]HME05109.1 class I SAM-dependent methyltransferase [Solirubrobacteraceae bacterium]
MQIEAVAPTPAPQSLELIRSCAQAMAPDDDKLDDWYRKYSTTQAERLAADLEIVRRFLAPDAAIVEVGAVPLLLTLALAREGHAVAAVDIEPERFSKAISGQELNVAKCDIESEALPFPDASTDALIFNELLEHLRINPVATLREVRRVIRPGGLLLLSTPNLRSLDGIWNLIVHGRGYAVCGDVYEEYRKLEWVGHMGHVREYAPGDVKMLLEKLGFKVEALVFRGRERKRSTEMICRARPRLRRFVTVVARAV